MSLLIATVIIALAFDLVNGFHDAANSIATVVSTRVLTPMQAVFWAAFFNFIAFLIFPANVADSISKIVIIEPSDAQYVYVVLAGLLAAIVWDLITWWLGLPSSSSHALIGGLSGAGIAHAGWSALHWGIVAKVVLFIFIAPLLGLLLGALFTACSYLTVQKWTPRSVQQFFSRGQLFSAALYSIGHGANDAQKTMGVIVALFVAAGIFSPQTQLTLTNPATLWIIVSCHIAIAAGTALGGWRIVRTMGMRLVKLKPIGGFSAESSGALTLYLATLLGVPVSTTQTIAGAIIGVGTISSHPGKIHWSVAAQIVWAWILTIPAAALLSAALFFILNL